MRGDIVDDTFKNLIKHLEYSISLQPETLETLFEYSSIAKGFTDRFKNLHNRNLAQNSLKDSKYQIAVSKGFCSVCQKPISSFKSLDNKMMSTLENHMSIKIKSDFRNNKVFQQKFLQILDQNRGHYKGVIDLANIFFSLRKDLRKVKVLIENFRNTLDEPKNILFINKSGFKFDNPNLSEETLLKFNDIVIRPERM